MFDNIGPDDVELPTTIKYRIRLDTDKVDSTKKIKDKYVMAYIETSISLYYKPIHIFIWK